MKFGAFALCAGLIAQGCSGGTNSPQTSAASRVSASAPRPSVSAAHSAVGLPPPGRYANGTVPTLKDVYTMPPPSPRWTLAPRSTPVPCPKPAPALPATYWDVTVLTRDQREVLRKTFAAVHATHPSMPDGPVVTSMSQVGGYARVRWDWVEAPGMSLLTKRGGRWSLLYSAQGAIGIDRMIRLGVPKPDAVKLEADMSPLVHEIGARLTDSTTATARYWLTITSAHGPAWLPPVIGGGTLRVATPSHAHTFALVPLLNRPGFSSPQMLLMTLCDVPISFQRGAGGRVDAIVRYAFLGKGVDWRTTVIDAESGRVVR